jgi:natural product biosynthesis luciferase-like monooxygenase protein
VKSRWVLHARGSVQRKYKETHPSGTTKTVRPISFSPMFFAASEDSLEGELYRLVIEAGRFADRNGFAAVWVPERHFTHFGAPIQTQPCCTPRWRGRLDLYVCGRAASSLHYTIRFVSLRNGRWWTTFRAGRVEVSFAAGWNPTDFALSPEKYGDRHGELFHAIEVIKQLLRGESIEVRNGKGELEQIRSYPTPVQRDMPVWVTAAGNPDVFARAGAIGRKPPDSFAGSGHRNRRQKDRPLP